MPDIAFLPLVILVYGGGAWLAFIVLRAIWRSFSAPAVARKAGEITTKLEDAYRDGRGR